MQSSTLETGSRTFCERRLREVRAEFDLGGDEGVAPLVEEF